MYTFFWYSADVMFLRLCLDTYDTAEVGPLSGSAHVEHGPRNLRSHGAALPLRGQRQRAPHVQCRSGGGRRSWLLAIRGPWRRSMPIDADRMPIDPKQSVFWYLAHVPIFADESWRYIAMYIWFTQPFKSHLTSSQLPRCQASTFLPALRALHAAGRMSGVYQWSWFAVSSH